MTQINLIFINGHFYSETEIDAIITLVENNYPEFTFHIWHLDTDKDTDIKDIYVNTDQSQYLYDKILKEIDQKYILVGDTFSSNITTQIMHLAIDKNLMIPLDLIIIKDPFKTVCRGFIDRLACHIDHL
jgi:hypothetical protein